MQYCIAVTNKLMPVYNIAKMLTDELRKHGEFADCELTDAQLMHLKERITSLGTGYKLVQELETQLVDAKCKYGI